ncbi:transglutaminase domain-containing protein [Candidatus Woesearchaeota archaeon]|nr:transglutaminase domain-containing protein [Candidatus Woesearchaeota archaeon]
MKLLALIIFSAALMPFVIAESPLLASRNVVQIDISNRLEVIPTASDYSIEFVKSNITLLPDGYDSQKILSAATSPDSRRESNTIVFDWQNPGKGNLDASIKIVADVQPWQPEVNKKSGFPIRNLNPELVKYTLPTEKIDSDNPEVIMAASGIAEGEDDLYVVAFKAANWTQKNVEYNLSTLTADVSQKASWVLKNRQGVCDELTTLYIAMLRSLGIPARFVSGVAYTDSPLFPEKWGPHGWAEVYFPDYGWVPFDVTYGEFGYLDAAHVKFIDGVDSEDASIGFSSESFGRNVRIDSEGLKLSGTIISTGDRLQPQVRMSARMIQEETGFGSYNLAELTLQNLKQYYVAVEVIAGKTKGLQIEEPVRQVLLKPGEKRREYFYISVDDSLDRGYRYTFPIGFYATRNDTAFTEFESGYRSETYSKPYFDSYKIIQPASKSAMPGLEFNCSPDKGQYYTDEPVKIKCSSRNIGNTYLDNVQACSSDCDTFDLAISQSHGSEFTIKDSSPGNKSIIITASNYYLSKSATARMAVMDVPKVRLASISYPAEVSYEDSFNISIVAEKLSSSNPYNLVVSAGPRHIKRETFTNSEKLLIGIKASELNEGANEILLKADYSDLNGRHYSDEKTITVHLKELSPWQRIKLFILHLLPFSQE